MTLWFSEFVNDHAKYYWTELLFVHNPFKMQMGSKMARLKEGVRISRPNGQDKAEHLKTIIIPRPN